MAACGFKLTQGKSFVNHDISSPVVNDITMQIVLMIMLLGSMHVHLVDVNGGILLGEFKLEEKIFMKILCGFEKYYPSGVLLFLKQTLYGVKNAAKNHFGNYDWVS